MIESLPAAIQDVTLPNLVRQACLECFLADVRSMIEFCGIRTNSARDFSARDFVLQWEVPTKPEKRLLKHYHDLANQHVMHFINNHAMQPDGTWLHVDPAIADEMEGTVLAVSYRFGKAVETRTRAMESWWPRAQPPPWG